MTAALAGPAPPRTLRIGGTVYPVLLPRLNDARLQLAAVIVSLQVLGQTVLGFRLSIAQILVSLLTCAVLEVAIAFRQRQVIMWPASALLTGNGVAFVLRVPGTPHADWWSLHGWWIFAGTSAVALLSKHVIRLRGRHVFNPSNFGLVLCFLVLGKQYAEPLDFWWAPTFPWVAPAIALIVVGGLVILSRLRLLGLALSFWAVFAAALAVLAAGGHAMTARWHLGPVTGWEFWRVLVFSPEILVFLFFMITDPKTTPAGRVPRLVYGAAVGLVAVLLIAPLHTEYDTKVAVLASLAIVCAGRAVLGLLPAPRRVERRRLAVLAGVGVAVYAAAVLGAGTAARSGAELPTAAAAAGLPQVVVASSTNSATRIDQGVANRIAQDVVARLGEGSRIDRIGIALVPRPDQRPPGIRVTLDGAGGLHRTLQVAATGSGFEIVGGLPTAPVAVELAAAGAATVPQGEPFNVRVVLRNERAASTVSSLELKLADVRVFSAKVLVPGKGRAVRRVALRPAAWFAGLGTYRVRAVVDGKPAGTPLAFELTRPRLVVPRFRDVTKQAGLATALAPSTCGRFTNGAAWSDVNGDGRLDLFLTRSARPSRLFVQVGSGRFVDQARARGVAVTAASGAAFADYDNDGDDDLLVARSGAPSLLLSNDGTGRFRDVTRRAGIASTANASSVSWADYDGDGNVDLYITNYMRCRGKWTVGTDALSKVDYFADKLYRNRGNGTFADATSVLHGATRGAGFAAAWFDYNGDNRSDLYLANDFVGPQPDSNRLWRNDGRGKFTDVSTGSGTGLYMNAMGIGVGDFNRDGRLDLAISDVGGNKLLQGRTGGAFRDVSARAGIARQFQSSGRTAITWGVGAYDFNLDGWEDLYFGAGNIGRRPGGRNTQQNELFVNDGTGRRFLDLSAPSGADDPGESKGVAFADYDGDGRMDVFVVNQDGAPRLYRNVTPRRGAHWLEVDPAACGARVVATLQGGASLVRQVFCGSTSVGSGSERAVHFGLGRATRVERLTVTWPSGARQVLRDVRADRLLTIREPARSAPSGNAAQSLGREHQAMQGRREHR